MKKKVYIIGGIAAIAVMAIVVFIFAKHGKVTTGADQSINVSIGDLQGTEENQNYWHGSGVTKGDGGYYYLAWDDASGSIPVLKLKFYDTEQKCSIVVCGKADCKHNGVDCNACFPTTQYMSGTVYYYDQQIYVIKIANGMSVLERVSMDGSSRQELAQLFPNDNRTGVKLAFHEGDAYAIDTAAHSGSTEEAESALKKISLKDGSVENVYTCTGVGVDFANMRSYGDKLFFCVGSTQLNKSTLEMSIEKKLFAYDYTTGETKQVSDAQIYDYCIDTDQNTMYYFVMGEGLYKTVLGQTEQVLIKKADENLLMGSISYDGKYVYVYNTGTGSTTKAGVYIDKVIYVLDTDGNEVRNIQLDKSFSMVYFGDQNYFFASKSSNQMVYWNKKLEGDIEWSVLN